MPDILHEKIIFDNWFNVEEAEIADGGSTYSRMRLNRPEAAAVLVYNKESKKFILTEQFRYAIAAKTKAPIIEVVAGKMDDGESPEKTAIRECQEETGYRISPGSLQHICSCFASPGYTSELLHLYYAEVDNKDKTGTGGGLAEEHEAITLVEMDCDDFTKAIKNLQLSDAKTLLCGLWFIQNKL